VKFIKEVLSSNKPDGIDVKPEKRKAESSEAAVVLPSSRPSDILFKEVQSLKIELKEPRLLIGWDGAIAGIEAKLVHP